MTELSEILSVMEYTREEIDNVLEVIGSLHNILLLTRESLVGDMRINGGMFDELMILQEWYIQWLNSDVSKTTSATEIFTIEAWDRFIIERCTYENTTQEARANKVVKRHIQTKW